jgi:hypothetical protein
MAYLDCVKEVERVSSSVRFHDDLRPFLDIVMAKCPQVLSDSRSETISDTGSLGRQQPITIDRIAELNRSLTNAKREKEKWEWEWKTHCETAFFYQDILSNQANPDKKFKSSLRLSKTGRFREFMLALEWYWLIYGLPLLARSGAVVCGFLSIAVIWSELLYAVPRVVIGFIGIIFNAPGMTYGAIEVRCSCDALFYPCRRLLQWLFCRIWPYVA